MLARLNEERMKAQTQRQRFYSETTDYYTMWVHQIKTPISALRLLLSEHEDENQGESWGASSRGTVCGNGTGISANGRYVIGHEFFHVQPG